MRAWQAALGAGVAVPGSLASAAGAAALARAATRAAAALSEFGDPIVGVGLTAALATDRARRGGDRVHVCALTGDGALATASLTLAPSSASRAAQDAIASRLLLRTLAAAAGVGGERLALGLGDGDALDEARTPPPADPVAALLAGRIACLELCPGAPPLADAPRGRGRVYLPGSFNPPHAGHAAALAAAVAAAAAAGDAGLAPACELSVVNADKGALTERDVRARVAAFAAASPLPLVLTRAPLFADKAALFGEGAAFVVGVDTADRIVDPRYYAGGTPAALAAALAPLAAAGVRVYVAGRAGAGAGAPFRTLADVAVPPEVAAWRLLRPVPGFRLDASSTEIRAREAAKGGAGGA